MSMLDVRHIDSGYGNKQVLFDVSLDVEEGEVVLLIGSNGSGKSTLLKVVYGLTSVWSGSVVYDGSTLQSKEKASPTHKLIKRGIQYVPQKNELFDDASVKENLQYSLLHLNNRKEAGKRVDEVLEAIPTLKSLLTQRVAKLSGGERKILALGMVMANRPKLLLYDEPLAGLSEDNIPIVLDLLGKLRKVGTTMLIVEHHVMEMMAFADKTYGIRLGKLSVEPLKTMEKIQEIML